MSTKHTPGPWYFRTNRHPETDGRAWGWVDAAPPGGPQKPIPGVRVEWTRGETSEANARLIAAAPDLLQALREARDHEFNEFEPNNQSARYKRWSALITKITGEEA